MTMRSVLKKLVLGSLGLIVLVVAIVVALVYASVPGSRGEHTVAGLDQPVSIQYDEFQRPYVTAESLEDALFTEGWLHATHRLWQMELFRRAAQGRLSELLGSGMLESDKELWRIGVPQLARDLEANSSEQMRAYIRRYVAGINAAIESARVPPPEYLLLQARPTPWDSSDVYAMGALMAFQSAGNMENELLRLALFDELGEERAALFLPDDGARADVPYVMPIGEEWSSARLASVLDDLAATDPIETPLMPRFAFGSNGWVVAPSRSRTGNALFAFDSHDALGVPNLFYEIHLFFGDGNQIRGWSVAGLPGVINGYNEKIAWGFTNIGDTQDLFLETRSEEDPLQFKNGEEWYTARTETVEIPVSGRETPEQLTIVYTLNGPLISDDPPISLRWTVQDLDGMGIDTILDFNRAQSVAEFARVLDRFPAPTLNATIADIDGNIGFRTAGLIPLRGNGEGLLPLPGDDPANRWKGVVDSNELPEIINPEQGFVAAANARVNAEGDGPLISADNAPGYRVRRIQSVLSTTDDLTADDMRALQTDWHDTQAELLLPSLMAAIAPDALSPLERQAYDALTAWKDDPVADPDLAAPLIFQAWYRALAVEVFEPALSDAVFKHLFRSNYPLNHALDRLILREPDSTWWRDDYDGLIRAGLGMGVDEIRAQQGDDVSRWRLDRMHEVKMEHELGKAVPQLAWFFNLRPAPWGGSATTVGRARYRYDRAYDVTAAATVRVVGEMTDPPRMQAVTPAGQSGHPRSPHYGDQLQIWLDRAVIPIASSLDDATGDRIVLTPEREK